MSGHLRIYAELRGHGARGPRYLVRMNQPDDMVIVNATTEPLYAAARVLQSKGVTGRLQLWDATRPYCRLQGDIEHLAGMTVSEGDRGICLRPYTERTASGHFDEHGVRVSVYETQIAGALRQTVTGRATSDRDVTGADTSERAYTTKHGTIATMNTSARSAVAA